jgi:hypothetical protein
MSGNNVRREQQTNTATYFPLNPIRTGFGVGKNVGKGNYGERERET